MRFFIIFISAFFFAPWAPTASAYQWSDPVSVTRPGETVEYSEVLNGVRGETLVLWRTTDPGKSFLTKLSGEEAVETHALHLPPGGADDQIWLHAVADVALQTIAVVTERTSNEESALWVVRSGDGGQTWSSARRVGGSGSDDPIGAANVRLVASSDLQVIATAWTRPGGSLRPALVSVSTDGGTTWGPTNTLSDTSRDVSNIDLDVDRFSGRIVFGMGYSDQGSEVSVSVDSGVSWSSGFPLPQDMSLSALRIDPVSGALLGLGRLDDQGLFGTLVVSRSGDGGVSWAAPTSLVDAQNGRRVLYPKLSTASTGDVHLATWIEETIATGRTDFKGAISADGGESWAGTVAFSGSGSAYYPQPDPAVSRSGANMIVGWYEPGPQGGVQLMTRSSTDAGTSWLAITPATPPAFSPLDAKLAQDLSSPRRRAIWHDAEVGGPASLNVASTSANGLSWGAVRALSEPALSADSPNLVMLADGVLVSTWLRRRQERWVLEASRSVDEGRSWESPTQIGNSSISSGFVRLVGSNRLDSAFALWRTEELMYGITRTLDGGATWEELDDTPVPAGASVNLDLSVDAGSLHLLWTVQGMSGFEIWSARSTDFGESWSLPVLVVAGDTHAVQAVSADGLKIHMLSANRQFGSSFLHSTSSVDGGASWRPIQQISTDEAPNAWSLVVSDDGMRVAAGWQEFRSSGQRYVVRTSGDGGISWSAPADFGGSSLSTGGFQLLGSRTGQRTVALWKSASQLHIARSEDFGLSWSEVEDQVFFFVGSGTWSAVAASEDASKLTFLSVADSLWQTASVDAGRTWTIPRRLTTSELEAGQVSVAVTAAGDRGVAIWRSLGRSGAAFVQASAGAGLFDTIFAAGFEADELPVSDHPGN